MWSKDIFFDKGFLLTFLGESLLPKKSHHKTPYPKKVLSQPSVTQSSHVYAKQPYEFHLQSNINLMHMYLGTHHCT